jgi:hypothetical protein
MHKTLSILILSTVITVTTNAQVISQFSWEGGSKTTADAGPNATSISSGSAIVTPGSGGAGHGISANGGGDINLTLPGTVFTVPGLVIRLDWVRKENGASFFTLGGMDIGINTGASYAKFQLNNGGSPVNISLNNIMTMPSDLNWHTYQFMYDNVSGYFTAYLDGVQKYSNPVGTPGQALYWTGATNAIVGQGMDGSGATIPILDNFLATTPLYVLPVSITAFDATTVDNKSSLNWSAETTGTFTIERSTDGSNFTAIGSLPAEANTTDYQFVDNDPKAINFYRLKIADANGNITYSPIRKLAFETSGATIRCYPNPVVNYATIHLDNTKPETVHLSVTTLDGRVLQSGQLTANPGQDLALDLSTAPKGILLVSIGTQTIKVMKF